jgi:hypothetical protein
LQNQLLPQLLNRASAVLAQILVFRNLTTNTGQDNGSIKPDLVITDLKDSNKLSSYLKPRYGFKAKI